MTRTKRVITLLAALALTAALGAPALALGDIDLQAEGTLTVKVQPEHAEEYGDDLTDRTVPMDVYWVATVNEYGAFTPTEPFASLAEDPQWKDGVIYNKKTTSDPSGDTQVKALLEAALALVRPEAAEGGQSGEAGPSAIEPIITQDVNVLEDTIALGNRLGLFLVVPGHLTTSLWEYDFNPALLAVPSIQRADDPDDGEWVYEVPMFLKCERERRLMDMEIVKNLRTYNKTLGPVTFVFDVTATLNGEVVFQTTAEITFDDSTGAQKAVTVKNIPAGAHVTVKEVYTGQSYEVVGSDTVNFDIVDLNLPDGQDIHRAEFTNDYNGGRIPDAHVENIFTATKDDDGNSHWEWHSDNGEGGNG